MLFGPVVEAHGCSTKRLDEGFAANASPPLDAITGL